MRLLFPLLFCVLLASSSQAQERVRNVRIRVVDSSRIDVLYDMLNTRFGDSVFLDVRSRLRGTLRIAPEFVRGDVGRQVTAGSDRRIIWEALANGYSLNEEIQARVLVKARPAVSGESALSAAQAPSKAPPAAPRVVVTTPVHAPARPETVPVPAKAAVVPAPVGGTPPVPAASEPVLPQKKAAGTKPSVFAIDSVEQVAQSAPVVVSAPITPPVTPAVDSPKKPAPQSKETETAAPSNDARRERLTYKGPAWALLSAVAPGVGNIFVQTPKAKIGLRPLVTVGFYGLLIYGLSERTKAQDVYLVYEQQKNREAGEPYYQTANGHHQRYFLATRGALVVAATDVVLTFIKGLRNSQIQKEAQRFKSLTLRPGLQVGQPTAVVRYSF
ncbi:hypothetical protein [Spirosoma linguale]|uniref:DUF5683 domain-containing protein n=1 Tax=Spirosoma linguale (strain ATCC 33905 / DSM 74 / LMG 10896 / Claus 1) TaxID=504472 RepID=D2QND2_SPILD|nr:hypothetical protein Slin_3310 [Spirosoma linguale DSM 74]